MNQHLKILLIILFYFNQTGLIAQGDTNCKTDTSFHINGNIAYIMDIDTLHDYCGQYKEFDTTGILIVEGFYQIKDSVECLNCFDGSPKFHDIDGSWIKYAYERIRHVEIGIWKYYHPNGKLKMIGSYSGKVHSFMGSVEPYNWEMMENIPISKPVPVYISHEPLKTGQWQYYDDQGNNYLTEDYVDGILVYRVERE